MVQMHLRHFGFGIKFRQKKQTNNRIYQCESKKKSSCKAPLVYRMDALKHYNIEVVKL